MVVFLKRIKIGKQEEVLKFINKLDLMYYGNQLFKKNPKGFNIECSNNLIIRCQSYQETNTSIADVIQYINACEKDHWVYNLSNKIEYNKYVQQCLNNCQNKNI